jgi:DNA-binding transcriptional ArsR family regulator
VSAAAETPATDDPAARRPGNPVVLRDPQAIKALAHPARLAVIEAFFAGRRLTATECGDIAGLSASAMSYHLRALERWGIIRRSSASGDGRERPWEAAGDRLSVDSAEPRATAAGEAMLVATMLDRVRAETLAWVANQDSAWYDSVSINSGSYWLTAEEARELSEAIAGAVAGYQRRSVHDAPTGARRVRVAFTVVPSSEVPSSVVPSGDAGQPEVLDPAADHGPNWFGQPS